MAKDTQSGQKSKDDEVHSSRRSSGTVKGQSNLDSQSADTSSSRRSSREALLGKMTSNPSSIRKSTRFDKPSPSTPPATRKSERLVKQTTPSPLRRSDRGKKHISSSPLGLNHSKQSSITSDAKKKEKKEKSLKKLTMEPSERPPSEKSLKRKRMDARCYKAMFKPQRIRVGSSHKKKPDRDEKLDGTGSISQSVRTGNAGRDSQSLGDREDGGHECSCQGLEGLREEVFGGVSKGAPQGVPSCLKATISEHDKAESLPSNRGHSLSEKPPATLDEDNTNISKIGCSNRGTTDEITKGRTDYANAENMHIPKLVGSTCVGRSTGANTGLESIDDFLQSKNKRFAISTVSDDTGTEIDEDICSPVAEAAPTSSDLEKHNFVGNCVLCSKRQRLNYDSPEEELCCCITELNENFRDNSQHKDSGNVEPAVHPESVERCDGGTQLKSPSDVQTDSNIIVCVMCKQGGKLLCCDGKGCGTCYHLSCLDPPLDNVPPGIWHCSYCVKKKTQFGVYAVSKGLESILDARDVVVSNAKGTQKQKQYLVKYQGLAHVYNHWVPETQLLHEAPSLVAKFNQEHQSVKWNSEWMVPCRLLRKRFLMSFGQQDMHNSINSEVEWLVKWRGLDYEHATWEVENASVLLSPQGQKLMREYEARRDRAKKVKRVVDESSKGSFVNLQKPPIGGSGEDYLLNYSNKLHEAWHKKQHAVIFDEQDRLTNMIHFISSLWDARKPFLITSTFDALCQWEAEFMNLAPSVNVVVYNGDRDTRKSIRSLEFYEEEGGVMLQVLLSPIEVVIEDLLNLKELKWEMIIIDECQYCSTSVNLEQLKILDTDMRVLLFNGHIKDTITEYLGLLSLLYLPGDHGKAGGLKPDSSDNLLKLKESFSRFIVYGTRSESSKFVEYWAPVQLSNVQLEQYCDTLLANSSSLRSNLRTDQVGAFQEILMAVRKCCDHPYMVDSSLQASLIEGLPAVEILDVGIKASGKLELLDKILLEIKSRQVEVLKKKGRQLRVLILFQAMVGSGGVSIGDILDDFLRQRFGPNSYERIEACVPPSKKQAALNRFNKKGSEQFVFLLENRACHSGIKLLSVDVVIIFDSEWNPANDLRALQRISIDSQSEQISVFRLYSSCTIEEKVLILGKQYLNLENNLQNISRSTSDALLMWGASYLFNRLDDYHARNITTSAADVSYGQSLVDDVVKDILAILSDSFKDNAKDHNFVISKVCRSAGTYHTDPLLLGERNIQLLDGEEHHIVWRKLLDGRNPRWKFLCEPTPRNRKRVLYADGLARKSEIEYDEAGKKRRKVGNICNNAMSIQSDPEEGQVVGSKRGASMAAVTRHSQSLPTIVACRSGELHVNNVSNSSSRDSSSLHQSSMSHPEVRSWSDEQKSLHALLKAEMSKLCSTLKLSEAVKHIVERFLEYVMENHFVRKERKSILQAFQMSLCWIAASILRQKIDRKDSLLIAKQLLDFQCTEEEADCVYEKLQSSKETFLQLPGNMTELISSNNFASASGDMTVQSTNAGQPLSASFNLQNVKAEVEEGLSNPELILEHTPKEKVAEYHIEKRIKKVQKNCEKRMLKLRQDQEKEIQGCKKLWEERRAKLEEEHKLEITFVRAIHKSIAMQMERLKKLENEFAGKMGDHERLKEVNLNELEAKHLAELEEEREKSENWLAQAKSCSSQCRIIDELHINCKSGPRAEEDLDRIVPAAPASEVLFPDTPSIAATKADGCNLSVQTIPISLVSAFEKDVEARQVDILSALRVEQPKEANHSLQGAEAITAVNTHTSEEQIADETPSSNKDNHIASGVAGSAACESRLVHAVEVSTDTTPVNVRTSEKIADEVPLMNQINKTDLGVLGDDGSEMGNVRSVPSSTSIEPTTGNDRGNTASSDVIVKQKGQVDSSSCVGLPSTRLSSVDHGDSFRKVHVESLHDTEFMSMQDKDVLATGDRTATVGGADSTPVDAGGTSKSNCVAQLPASDDVAPGCSQPAATEAVYQGHSKGSNSLLNSAASPQLDEEPVVLAHQAVSCDGKNMALQPSTDVLDSAHQHNPPDIEMANRTDRERNSELSVPSQNTVAPFPVGENASELLNQAVLQSGPNLAVSQDGENLLSTDVFDSAHGYNHPDLQTDNRTDHETNNELFVHAQNTVVPSQVVDNASELPNQAVLQSGPKLAVSRDGQNLVLEPSSNAFDSAHGHKQPDLQIANGTCYKPTANRTGQKPNSELSAPLQNVVAPSPVVENASELLNQAISQGGEVLVREPSADVFDLDNGHNRPDLQLANRTDHESNGELSGPSQNILAPSPVVENASELLNQAGEILVQQRSADVFNSAHGHSHPDLQTADVFDSDNGHNLPDLQTANRTDHESNGELSGPSQNIVAPSPVVGNASELLNQADSQAGEILVRQSSAEVFDSAHGHNHPDLQTANRTDQELNNDLSGPTEITATPSQVVQNAPEPANQAVSHSGPSLTTVEGPIQLPLHHARHVAPLNATLSLHAEPLQIELERIHKELEQATKLHDSTKLQLKSECEKEIEELVAQIRNKYEAKLKDAEAAFLLKMSQLDLNQNKVLMNKVLAEAFRSKCLDLRPSGISGVHQAVPSSFLQHLQSTMRHPNVSSLPSGGQPSIAQQTVNPSAQSTLRSSGSFSGIARPPQISSITPTISNVRLGADIRAPAPHLQPFRPTSSMSSANTSRNIPSHQVPACPSANSLSFPPPPPQQSLAVPVPILRQKSPPSAPQPPPPVPSLRINQSFSGRRPSEPEGRALPVPHMPSLSALESLRDVHNPPSGYLANIRPSLPDFILNTEAVDISDTQTIPNVCRGAKSSALPSDVVCLSDDDD